MAILTEELALLAYRDDTGRNQIQHIELGLAGAILLDLTVAERIDLQEKRVVVTDPKPVGHPLLDPVLARMAADKPRRPRSWIEKLRGRARQNVLASLVDQSILTHDADKVLGVIPFNRYRPANPAVEADIRARLEYAIDMGQAQDDRTAALGGLVYALKMEKVTFPNHNRREARRALKTISEGSWAATAAKKAIQATQAAINAAIVASASSAAGAGGS